MLGTYHVHQLYNTEIYYQKIFIICVICEIGSLIATHAQPQGQPISEANSEANSVT